MIHQPRLVERGDAVAIGNDRGAVLRRERYERDASPGCRIDNLNLVVSGEKWGREESNEHEWQTSMDHRTPMLGGCLLIDTLRLRKNGLDDFAAHVGESVVAALGAVGQTFVV